MRVLWIKKYKVLLDENTFKLIAGKRWSVSLKNGVPYFSRMENGRYHYLHRDALGSSTKGLIDHISGDTLDNRKKNLRIVTKAQNAQNSKLRSDSTSGFKGVSTYSYGNKYFWRANISVNKKQVNLGYFEHKEDAARAYDEAALKYYGKFSRLNFPEEAKNS